MKRFLALLLTLCFLTGCSGQKTAAPETEPPTEPPTAAPTEAPTAPPAPSPYPVPYMQEVPQANESVFSGPGYDYDFAGALAEPGFYLIVAETQDTHGNYWGKLKTGNGWIDLTRVRGLGGSCYPYEEPATEAPTEPPTEPPTEAPTEFASYLITIPRATQPIYQQPTYSSKMVGTVEIAGIYTIVDEAWDSSGILWGKLKSGAGWVDLLDIQRSTQEPELEFTVDFATDYLLNSNNYHYLEISHSAYTCMVVIRVNKTVRDFEFMGYYRLDQLTPQKPLVVSLEFTDTNSFYFTYYDETTGYYESMSFYQSGKDGSIVLY